MAAKRTEGPARRSEAAYFGVARVGEEQAADYATRRGVDIDTARRWLRPNLD